MKARCILALLLCVPHYAPAYPAPPRGTENIPQLMSDATLVCKGEVVDAPEPVSVISSEPLARNTATARLHPDRCFKGSYAGQTIPVRFDGILPAAGGPHFVLHKGDYLLFFLKPQDRQYIIVDQWFGALPASREVGAQPSGADCMYLLELDLKAGLNDSNPERVRDSIRMLGNMKHLRSTAELKALLDTPDLLEKTYVWQALLRLKDYSVMPAVSEFFESHQQPPTELLLPRDELYLMQFELEMEIMTIRDPATLPYLHRFALSPGGYRLRDAALQAMRQIGSPKSAPTYLAALDDSNADNAFSAMQGLLTLAGGGPIPWVPTWKQFDEAPRFYAAQCRDWWNAEGKQAAARATATSK